MQVIYESVDRNLTQRFFCHGFNNLLLFSPFMDIYFIFFAIYSFSDVNIMDYS